VRRREKEVTGFIKLVGCHTEFTTFVKKNALLPTRGDLSIFFIPGVPELPIAQEFKKKWSKVEFLEFQPFSSKLYHELCCTFENLAIIAVNSRC
jgi:hypothetical protein